MLLDEGALRQLIREEVQAALQDHPWDRGPTLASSRPDELLTFAEAAAYARRGVSTIRAWCDSGKLPRRGTAGRPAISRADLDRVLKAPRGGGADPASRVDELLGKKGGPH